MGKLDVEIEVVKCKIHQEDVVNDFKEKLEYDLDNEYNKSSNKSKSKFNDKVNSKIADMRYYFARAAMVFACFIVVSSCAFADEIEGIFNLIFANSNKNIEIAYENGDIQEVNSEYQTYNGVSMKVDYISVNEKNIYVVLDFKSNNEHSGITMDDVIIKNQESEIIYDSNFNSVDYIAYNYQLKRENKNEAKIIAELSTTKDEFINLNKLNISIGNIKFKGTEINVNGDWNFELNINK